MRLASGRRASLRGSTFPTGLVPFCGGGGVIMPLYVGLRVRVSVCLPSSCTLRLRASGRMPCLARVRLAGGCARRRWADGAPPAVPGRLPYSETQGVRGRCAEVCVLACARLFVFASCWASVSACVHLGPAVSMACALSSGHPARVGVCARSRAPRSLLALRSPRASLRT